MESMPISPTIGPYRLLGRIGRGGMGVVHQGCHEETGERVAIKTVRLPRRVLVQSLRREIRALARLDHPGVVRIVDNGVHEGMPWYAMEFIEGNTVRVQFLNSVTRETVFAAPEGLSPEHTTASGDVFIDSMARVPTESFNLTETDVGGAESAEQGYRKPEDRRSVFPPLEALNTIVSVCQILAYIHTQGIVHRDLKPDNIILRAGTLEPILVDFGLVAHFESGISREALKLDMSSLGTISYISPEQIRGDYVDARADLYSLGCIIYELLTGLPPFIGSRVSSIVYDHLYMPPQSPSAIRGDIPPAIDDLVMRLLAKSPRDRPGYADIVSGILVANGYGPPQSEMTPSLPGSPLYRPAFVGRDRQVAQICEEVNTCTRGEGAMVLVEGESGVGKTRLVLEAGRLFASHKFRILTGVCPDRGCRPFEAFREPLVQIAEFCHLNGPQETELVFGKRGPILAAYEPAIGDLPGQSGLEIPAELPGDAARLRLFRALADVIAAFSRHSPTVLILDDLQWADELSLAALHHFISSGFFERVPCLVCCTYRLEKAGHLLSLKGSSCVRRVILDRLAPQDMEQIVRSMLAVPEIPSFLPEFCAARAEGNPFIASEYLRMLVDRKMIGRTGERWHLSGTDTSGADIRSQWWTTIPDTVADLVGERLGTLSSDACTVAEYAAILGKEIDLTVLCDLSGLGETPLFDATEELIRSCILERHPSGGLTFVHDKIRESILAGLEGSRRSRLHRAAAECLERRSGDRDTEREALIGHHWESAGEPDIACRYYLSGARAAVKRYAYDDSEQLYRAFLALQPLSSTRIDALTELAADVLHVQGKNRDALQVLQNALGEATRCDYPHGQAVCLRFTGNMHYALGQHQKAFTCWQEALTLSGKLNDRREEGRLIGNLALIHIHQGNWDAAMEMYEQDLAIAREFGDLEGIGQTMTNLAILHFDQGHSTEAMSRYQQALTLATESGNRFLEARTVCNIAGLYYQLNDLKQAMAYYQRAIDLAREIGGRKIEGVALGYLARLLCRLNELESALALFTQALRIHQEIGSVIAEGYCLGNLADLLEKQGRFVEAHDMFERALKVGRSSGDRQLEAIIAVNFAEFLYRHGSPESALELVNQATSLAEGVGNRRLTIHAGILHARILRLTSDDYARTESMLEQIESLCTDIDDRYSLVQCLGEKGFLLLATSRPATEAIRRIKRLLSTWHSGTTDIEDARDFLEKLIRAQTAFDSDKSGVLFRGELITDLPATFHGPGTIE